MTNSTSDLFSTSLASSVIFNGEAVRYTSSDLPNVLVTLWAHEDGNRNLCEIDVEVCGLVGYDHHAETHLVRFHDAVDHIHGVFSALLS